VKTIVWDVDDVLNDLMRAWLEAAWGPVHPGAALPYERCTENPPHRLLGCTLAAYLASLDAFRLSEAGRNLAPDPGALAWFEAHGARYRHVALTAAPLAAAPHSAAWVLRHFGRWIRSFHFVPSPRLDDALPVYDRSKAEFLDWFGRADLLVDDNPEHVAAAAARGLPAVLVPRPWNGGRGAPAAALAGIAERLPAGAP
jgi:hypothetical protein